MNRALTVQEALARVLAGAQTVAGEEMLGLDEAPGRVLAEPLVAHVTQPPFDASAMDGYAVRAADVASLPARLHVIGESAAGRGYTGIVGRDEAVRIFTGAPIPNGANAIVIQENTKREEDYVLVAEGRPDPEHIRPKGGDFAKGDVLLAPGARLSSRDITLAAAMGHAELPLRRKPRVAILATGNELVPPGVIPGPHQIVCSNTFGIAAMVRAVGATPVMLGIARDTEKSLRDHLEGAVDCDVLVTIGGASVGDHDLVGPVLAKAGMALDFWKIAMRPGKPLMYGRLGSQHVLGLPGNPVSSMVCTRLFVLPLLRALQGLPAEPEAMLTARTLVDLDPNGARAHYMRAITGIAADGQREVTPVPNQDSSLMRPLAAADCLIVRPIGAAAIPAGSIVPILELDF